MRNCHQRLAALRLISGLSAREAARRLGLKLTTYMALERGQEELTPGLLDAIAAMYDIPRESVCSGPLPIPRSYGYPFDAEDELSEHLLALYEIYGVIDRYRQAMGEEWPAFRKRLEAMTRMSLATPYPGASIVVPSSAPLRIYFDLPHILTPPATWRLPISVRQKGVERLRYGVFRVEPGEVELSSPRTVRLRIRPDIG